MSRAQSRCQNLVWGVTFSDNVESNASAPAEGMVPNWNEGRPTMGVRSYKPECTTPSTPPIPQPTPVAPQVVEVIMLISGRIPLCRLYQGKGSHGSFFQEEFKKKYISQRFLDQKRKEFLELKQGKMEVTDHERDFVRRSKYTRECLSTEAIMCRRFEDGLNEDIKLFVTVLKLKEFVVLVE
ncbi:E3 ubiquitin-protein ligase RBBP6 [Gossypium australe]|uniref:E3 ubiquitin-protein ligase RBBP6 n=1 Tax=Gossypium australe TaxID=47621 RepID=A0A5B6VVV7_9ROSI|nr:E3 ubiquitin-protein ligase RBBP6 [Gossypium australe]